MAGETATREDRCAWVEGRQRCFIRRADHDAPNITHPFVAPPAPVEQCVTCGWYGETTHDQQQGFPPHNWNELLAPAPQQVEGDEDVHADGSHCFGFESCSHLSHFVAGDDVTAEFEPARASTPPLIEGDRERIKALEDALDIAIGNLDMESGDEELVARLKAVRDAR